MIADLGGDHQHSDKLPERTKLALEWADVVLGGGHGADDALKARLQAAFTPAEIVEITYAIGTFIGYSKQIITLGMEPENLPLLVVPTPGG
jgi:alkylhydroperoxidase family enzyme